MRHQKTWMNSSAWGPHGRSLYGAHQWNAWHYGVGQTLKHQQWVDWPAGSSKLKRISLPPQTYRSASWLRRDYPNSSSYSKTAYLFPCPYQPPSQLLRGSSSLLKAKGTVGASVCLLVVFSVWPQTGRTWGSGMVNPPQIWKLAFVNCEEKQWPKRIHPGKLPLQLLLSNSPNSRKADPSSDPSKGLVVCSCKDQVMNALTRKRGALPPARQRKRTTRFIGLHGFDSLAQLISWLCFS